MNGEYNVHCTSWFYLRILLLNSHTFHNLIATSKKQHNNRFSSVLCVHHVIELLR